jgi:transcriptional regulator with XRE-family HTH domain
MIKNNIQLRRAVARLHEIRQQISDIQDEYSGFELELLITPLNDEAEELETEIREFQQLRNLALKKAVLGPLKEPILLDNIGELLSKLRIAANLTQQEMADQLGWQQSNISRFENESYHSQTIGKIVEYASSLGIWLHVTPSLTEKVGEIIYRQETISASMGDTVSTSSVPLKHEASDHSFSYSLKGLVSESV